MADEKKRNITSLSLSAPHPCTHTHTHTHARARAHTHTHTLTHTLKHTHTHTNTQELLLPNLQKCLLNPLLLLEFSLYTHARFLASKSRLLYICCCCIYVNIFTVFSYYETQYNNYQILRAVSPKFTTILSSMDPALIDAKHVSYVYNSFVPSLSASLSDCLTMAFAYDVMEFWTFCIIGLQIRGAKEVEPSRSALQATFGFKSYVRMFAIR